MDNGTLAEIRGSGNKCWLSCTDLLGTGEGFNVAPTLQEWKVKAGVLRRVSLRMLAVARRS